MPLEHLEQVQAAAADFAAALHAALAPPPGPGTQPGAAAATASAPALAPAEWAPVHRRILAPAEEALGQYGDRELAFLSAELARIASKGAPGLGSAPCVVGSGTSVAGP